MAVTEVAVPSVVTLVVARATEEAATARVVVDLAVVEMVVVRVEEKVAEERVVGSSVGAAVAWAALMGVEATEGARASRSYHHRVWPASQSCMRCWTCTLGRRRSTRLQ
jgi:hypothetical protein